MFYGPRTNKLMILDSEQRLLARSAEGFIGIVCPQLSACLGYLYRKGSILEPDVASMQRFDNRMTFDEQGEQMWEIYGDKESWGIKERKTSMLEFAYLEFQIFFKYGFSLGQVILIFVLTNIAWGVAHIFSSDVTIHVKIISIISGIFFFVLFLLLLFINYVFSVPTYLQSVFSPLLGLFAAFALLRWLRKTETDRPTNVDTQLG
ncbi:MAG: hypothetical protein R3D29_11995 [Nitratireductor sp.]